ncbi:OmpA family protein [Myxococcus stipitatus DSM 14675]|uniref:OmpA family protein n=1 Tax=Myxococcus stipitatus (strain DSM 14675 / JCM 12634 / Mx s8) TaxID=1278073 RepID=L7UH00_MYXSD|nr:hypothetical protein [Myxococcus stipitatus]AGC48256.1 OmpA family protein [Myxococcus stipitatus DSM 14675]
MGVWFRTVAWRLRRWVESVFREEESDFAAALAQARLAAEAPRPPPEPVPAPVPVPAPKDAVPVATAPAMPVTVTAPSVNPSSPEQWLRDLHTRRVAGPPPDWVERVRKVAPHLVENLPDASAPLAICDTAFPSRARTLLAGALAELPVSPPMMPPVVPTQPELGRASEPGPGRADSGASSEESLREAPRRAAKMTLTPTVPPLASQSATVPYAPGLGASSHAPVLEASPPAPLPGVTSQGPLLASLPPATTAREQEFLTGSGPVSPVAALMLRGAVFTHPVKVESTPVSPSEVCVPPLGEGVVDGGLHAVGFTQGFSASQAVEMQCGGVSEPPQKPGASTGELWIPRRRSPDDPVPGAEPRAPVSSGGTEGASPRPSRAVQVGSSHDTMSPSEISSALAEEPLEAILDRRLWKRLRWYERDQLGE